MAKRKVYKAKQTEPKYEDLDKFTGQQYARFKDTALTYYRLECKNTDYKQWTIDYLENFNYSEHKDIIDIVKKNPEREFNCTLGGVCRMLTKGLPDFYEPYAQYWRELPGTMGEVKPHSEFIKKQVDILVAKGKEIVEEKEVEKKKEEEKAKNVYRPSIQERIALMIPIMTDAIEQAIDDFAEGKVVDFKHIKPLSVFRQKEVKQPHAKIIQDYYEGAFNEMRELLNPPDTSKMTEVEKDWAQQLKDGYSHYDKRQIKKLH